MTYRILPPHLQSHAEMARKYFKSKGVTKFEVEAAVSADGTYRHTLMASTNDGHYVCVEVSESAYFDTLDAMVLEYRNRKLPVKLYVAIPRGTQNANFQKQLRQARRNGVGVLEVDGKGAELVHEALSQSLADLRQIDLNSVPAKYRSNLSQAIDTFRNGNPAKGCAMVYDEIEDLSRRIAKKTQQRGLWKKASKMKIDKDPWANVLDGLMNQLNYSACGCPKLKKPLLARVLGVTGHRNETGHKVRNRAELIKRDKELRTRFEGAEDLLFDLIEASKPLKV
jgi:hypothetical protein